MLEILRHPTHRFDVHLILSTDLKTMLRCNEGKLDLDFSFKTFLVSQYKKLRTWSRPNINRYCYFWFKLGTFNKHLFWGFPNRTFTRVGRLSIFWKNTGYQKMVQNSLKWSWNGDFFNCLNTHNCLSKKKNKQTNKQNRSLANNGQGSTCSHIMRLSLYPPPHYGARTYPGIYKKKVPSTHSPRQYLGLYLGCHKVKN